MRRSDALRLVALSAIWGSSFIFIRVIAPVLGPVLTVTTRVLIGGAVLVVSQFTLYGNTEKGRRPSFIDAARPEQAIPLYESFIAELRGRGLRVETGEFGAMMDVELVNDGPVTLVLEK